MMGTCTTAGTAAARAPIDSDCGALDTAVSCKSTEDAAV
jgi:hypothetical protein